MASDPLINLERPIASTGLNRSVGEGSPVPMAELDGPTHIVSYVNPAFCLLAGKTEQQLIGSNFSALAGFGTEFLSSVRRAYRTGQASSQSGDTHSESSPLYWSYVMWPVFSAQNRTLGIILQVTETASFHEDAVAMNQALLLGSVRQHELAEAAEHLAAQLQAEISARQTAEAALIRSEKLASVGRMAAVLAHEINNPLAAVMGILYLVQNTDDLPGPVAAYLERADGELKRIAHITRQTLGFYRESIHVTTFTLGPLFSSVLDLLKSKIESKSVTVEIQCDSNLEITAMHGELRQVVSNLVMNSLDSFDTKGRIVLRASASTDPASQNRRVRITIADNGRGISKDLWPEIFEAFYTTKGDIGNGLGLWVSKQIVDKHHGSIHFRSTRDGPQRGSTFSVVLPADAT